MEGTRHERAAIVLASYVIGFITAFILYANVTSNDATSNFINSTATSLNTATVADAEIPSTGSDPEVLPIEIVEAMTVAYAEGRLEVTSGEDINLLSFNPEVSGIDIDTSDLTQGFHFGQIEHKISPDNKFVFFCERQDVTASTCLGFIYDTSEKTIYPVAKEGVQVLISAESLAGMKFTSSGLIIGSSYSANASAPWILIDDNSKLDLQ
jgi:hypothetical protein